MMIRLDNTYQVKSYLVKKCNMMSSDVSNSSSSGGGGNGSSSSDGSGNGSSSSKWVDSYHSTS